MLQTTKQSSSANLLNLINHTSHPTVNIRRKPSSQSSSSGMSSPNTVKKFRAAWSETCDGEKLKQTMTATEIERQNVLYELFSEEQQMIENLGLAQRVRVWNRRCPTRETLGSIALGLPKWDENTEYSDRYRIETDLWPLGRYPSLAWRWVLRSSSIAHEKYGSLSLGRSALSSEAERQCIDWCRRSNLSWMGTFKALPLPCDMICLRLVSTHSFLLRVLLLESDQCQRIAGCQAMRRKRSRRWLSQTMYRFRVQSQTWSLGFSRFARFDWKVRFLLSNVLRLDQPRSRLMKYPILFKRIQKRVSDMIECASSLDRFDQGQWRRKKNDYDFSIFNAKREKGGHEYNTSETGPIIKQNWQTSLWTSDSMETGSEQHCRRSLEMMSHVSDSNEPNHDRWFGSAGECKNETLLYLNGVDLSLMDRCYSQTCRNIWLIVLDEGWTWR